MRNKLAVTALGALGVVYGDIGTSPLYAMRACLASEHGVAATEANVLGVLSLMLWSLALVVCIKYLAFVLRADNSGQGGIVALAALLARKRTTTRLALPLVLGLIGTGLLYGDGVITPAISVLGAMEGLSEHSHGHTYLVLPVTVAILVALFAVQRFGTSRIGRAFGPIMLVWFLAIGTIGLRWLVVEPRVLLAIDPRHGVDLLLNNGYRGFAIIGLVFLCVTGAEALYADVGHFGRQPIRAAWFGIALPMLVLSYLGQGALLLHMPRGAVENPFFSAAEGLHIAGMSLVIPMLVLSVAAAVVASQAVISGVFSITRQAMQLGFWPRMLVVHTSREHEGQIYIPEMNWLLMLTCIGATLGFHTSSGLAAAYGIAVSGTMVITTILFFLVTRQVWRWSTARSLTFLVVFLAIDLTFFSANAVKVMHGAWFSLLVGAVVFSVMTTWWRGRREVARHLESALLGEGLFLQDLVENPPRRVSGTAVFMSPLHTGIPNELMHHIKHNHALHEQVILLTLDTRVVPSVDIQHELEIHPLGQGLVRMIAHLGFLQTCDVPTLLAYARERGIVPFDPMQTTYYLGRQTLLTTHKQAFHRHFAYWRKLLFAFMSRNARTPTAYFGLPPNRVVELGLQIEL
jgi:KUP system potassium uptake protein